MILVADAYEAMTHDRAYRRAIAHAEAIERLREGAGTQSDPTIVECFVAPWNTLKEGRLGAVLSCGMGVFFFCCRCWGAPRRRSACSMFFFAASWPGSYSNTARHSAIVGARLPPGKGESLNPYCC